MEDPHDLLDDGLIEDHSEAEYVNATKGKRFINNLIDSISFYVIAILFYVLYELNNTGDFFYEENVGEEYLIDSLLTYVGYPLYYTMMEYFTNGKSLGKYVTKTRVIRKSEESFSFLRILGRSYVRLIPFEMLSIFFNDQNSMWHDNLSDTRVVHDTPI